MSKPLSRNSSGLDDATRAALRQTAPRAGASPGRWIDEVMRLRAQEQTPEPSKDRAGKDRPEFAVSRASEPGPRVAEIARRLQQRHDAVRHDVLSQSLAAAGQRLADVRARNQAQQGAEDISALRRELLELQRMTETASAQRSHTFQREIDELLDLLDDHIKAQKSDGVSDTLLAPATEISGQLRLAVANLDRDADIGDIRADIDAIGRRLDALCGPNSSSATAIADLSRQFDALRRQLLRFTTESPEVARFEAELLELARHVCMLAESGVLAQSRFACDLETLSRSIAELVAAETDRGLAVMRRQMSAVVADFGGALDRAGQKNLVEMDARLRHLGDTLSQSVSQHLEDRLSRHAADTAKLQSLTEVLAQKIDTALIDKGPENEVESLGRRMMRLEEQVREPQVADLLGRLDAMQAALSQSVESGENKRQAELAQQIEKLAVRIDLALDSQDSDASLSGLETQIDKLAARLDAVHDETLKMVETIARQAGESAALATLEKAGGASQATDQNETRETLRAVQEWLGRIGERFTTFEGVVRQLQETQNRSPAREVKTPDIADFMAHIGGASAPISAVEALAIPMAGEAAAVDARATQAGFIAAARRAARGRWTQDTQATLAEAASRSDGRFLTGLAAHRRSAVIALAAVMLLAGAFQLTQNVSVDGPRQMTAARDSTPPTPQEPVETAAKAKPTSSKQASTVDPAPVGAIVNPGRSGIVASMNSAMALATLAANGDAAAQFELASRYADGRDIARDSKLAVLWFDKAAKQGLAPAQYRLGTLYEKGLGVERNEAAAMDWYRRAADSGNIRAMHNLAVMLAEGGEGKPDYAAAAVWFRKAAELGLRDSQYNLAILYARGLGVETSLTQSYLWFSAAAAQGDADAGKKRDEVAARLGARDLETARALVAGFHAKTPVPAANDVVPPPGGWRAPAPTPSRAINKPKVSWFQSF